MTPYFMKCTLKKLVQITLSIALERMENLLAKSKLESRPIIKIINNPRVKKWNSIKQEKYFLAI